MRMDQYIGLNGRAQAWLDENVEQATTSTLTTTSINGVEQERRSTIHTGPFSTEYAHIEGAWDDWVAPLLRYTVLGEAGTKVEEYVQETKWSSGPMYFVALRYLGMSPCAESCLCIPSLYPLAWTDAEIDGEI